MAMKLFLIFLFSSLFFAASAQTKSTASVQQGITFRLLPVAVVERVSAASSSAGTHSNGSFLTAEARQKWAVQLKKITASDEQSYALLSAVAGNNRLQENLSSLQLCTVSKP